jgi:hypothetical protein
VFHGVNLWIWHTVKCAVWSCIVNIWILYRASHHVLWTFEYCTEHRPLSLSAYWGSEFVSRSDVGASCHFSPRDARVMTRRDLTTCRYSMVPLTSSPKSLLLSSASQICLYSWQFVFVLKGFSEFVSLCAEHRDTVSYFFRPLLYSTSGSVFILKGFSECLLIHKT